MNKFILITIFMFFSYSPLVASNPIEHNLNPCTRWFEDYLILYLYPELGLTPSHWQCQQFLSPTLQYNHIA